MEAKLKSISGQIPWSLLLKAVIFAASWQALPFWIFVAVALLLYLVPFFQPQRLAFPFFLTLILGAIMQPSFWMAVFLGIIFFFIIGVKDLVFVDRSNAFSLLVFVLLFLLIFLNYSKFDSGISFMAFASTLLIGASFFLLGRNSRGYMRLEEKGNSAVYGGVALLIFLEFALVALFLPLNFFGQTELLFLIVVILYEVLADYFSGKMTPRLSLIYFSLLFSSFVLILAFSDWAV